MNTLLLLSGIATHLRAEPALVGVHVGTGRDVNYLVAVPKTWPAVWLIGVHMTPQDDGGGYSGQYRQRLKVTLPVMLIVQRYQDGRTDAEARMAALHDAVAAALTAWQPEGADTPLVWESSRDGEPHDSLLSFQLVFSTTATYTSPT